MPDIRPASPGPRRPGPAAARPGTARRAKAPAARRRSALLLTTILAVLVAILLLVFVLRLATSPGGKVNIGASEFDLGRDTLFAPKVATNGPFIFASLRGSLTLYVQHLGADPAKGWLAFDAHDPGQATKCKVVWRPSTRDFIDPCTVTLFPADGQGLDHYATRVDPSGEIIINLRQPIEPTTAATVTTQPLSAGASSSVAGPTP